MSIPEACIEQAGKLLGHLDTREAHADLARRVILALAENLPDEAVDAAIDSRYPNRDWRTLFSSGLLQEVRADMRASIIAALKKIGGE